MQSEQEFSKLEKGLKKKKKSGLRRQTALCISGSHGEMRDDHPLTSSPSSALILVVKHLRTACWYSSEQHSPTFTLKGGRL